MDALILLLVAAVVFYLLWLLISHLPEPKTEPPASKPPFSIKWLLYVVLIVGAIVWLVTRYGLL